MLSLLLISRLITDLCRLFGLALKSRAALAAENLFLRKQLSLYEERKARRSNTSIAVRWTMAVLGKLFAWRDALVIVKPDTFVRWHREAFSLFWRWKSRPSGRPALPRNIRTLIRQMDRENPTWGEERIVDELMVKILREWTIHYNRGRPHSSLGPITIGTSIRTGCSGRTLPP